MNSVFFTLNKGTVQGLIDGPISYAIFVAPFFEIKEFLSLANDSYMPRLNIVCRSLISDPENSLEAVTKLLKQSGLKVRQEKTRLN